MPQSHGSGHVSTQGVASAQTPDQGACQENAKRTPAVSLHRFISADSLPPSKPRAMRSECSSSGATLTSETSEEPTPTGNCLSSPCNSPSTRRRPAACLGLESNAQKPYPSFGKTSVWDDWYGISTNLLSQGRSPSWIHNAGSGRDHPSTEY